MPEPPDFPAGEFTEVNSFSADVRDRLIDGLRTAADALRGATAGLSDEQLDTAYKNWTVRQITHHIADSHVHSYIRFKWALTEDNPTIKAYEEADWVAVEDCRRGSVEPALALVDGIHQKWVQTISMMSPDQFERTFVHPQLGETVRLWTALNYYPWHSRHHTAQILWLRERHGWS